MFSPNPYPENFDRTKIDIPSEDSLETLNDQLEALTRLLKEKTTNLQGLLDEAREALKEINERYGR